tara:strand:- start:88 stop:660 length:573 start_codon:yes stop_codon:yes gene_type:complete
MELPVQLANKLLYVVIVFFIGCNPNNQLVVHEESKGFDGFSKQTAYNGEVFSGIVFNTNEDKDTILIGEYKNGLKHGVWKTFYPNGSLKERRFYKRGLKVGLYEGFYNDGAKNFVFMFKNGEYNGTNSLWTKDGQLIEEFNYKMGREFGSQKVWYLDGKIKSNYIIKNNRRYGLLGTKNCTNVSEEVFDM